MKKKQRVFAAIVCVVLAAALIISLTASIIAAVGLN